MAAMIGRPRTLVPVTAAASVVLALCVLAPAAAAGGAGPAAAPIGSGTAAPVGAPVASGAAAALDGVPVGVPGEPVTGVSACPSSPGWSRPLPAGATVSPPTLGDAGQMTYRTTVDGRETTASSAGRCEYAVETAAGAQVLYIDFGQAYAAFDAITPGTVGNSYVQGCDFSTTGGFFYVAVAEIRNDSGACNTDGVGPLTNVTVANTQLQNGNTAFTNQFHTWTQSTIPGSPFFWTWEVCLQNPVGQHVHYVCGYGNLGPTL